MPLTADYDTEIKILQAKQKEREAQQAQLDKASAERLSTQEKADQNAEEKARKEAEEKAEAQRKKQLDKTTLETQKNDTQDDTDSQKLDSTPVTPMVKVRPEVIAAEAQAKKAEEERKAEAKKEIEQKPKEVAKSQEVKKIEPKPENNKAPNKAGQHTVVSGDNWLRLSRQYGIPVSVLASANNMGRNDALPAGKTIKIPSKAEAERIAKANEAKKAEVAKKETPKKENSKQPVHRYSVQVALLENAEKANEVAKQYKAAGYKVSTSQTSKGVRVLVGSEKNYDAAHTLEKKVANDSRVKTTSTFVKKLEE